MEPLSHLVALERLGLSLLAGSLLGFEREWQAKPAGLRTHALVCEGAALFMMGSLGKRSARQAAPTTIHPESLRRSCRESAFWPAASFSPKVAASAASRLPRTSGSPRPSASSSAAASTSSGSPPPSPRSSSSVHCDGSKPGCLLAGTALDHANETRKSRKPNVNERTWATASANPRRSASALARAISWPRSVPRLAAGA